MLRKTVIIVRQELNISNQVVLLNYCPVFKIFMRNHERNIKNHFFSRALKIPFSSPVIKP